MFAICFGSFSILCMCSDDPLFYSVRNGIVYAKLKLSSLYIVLMHVCAEAYTLSLLQTFFDMYLQGANATCTKANPQEPSKKLNKEAALPLTNGATVLIIWLFEGHSMMTEYLHICEKIQDSRALADLEQQGKKRPYDACTCCNDHANKLR